MASLLSTRNSSGRADKLKYFVGNETRPGANVHDAFPTFEALQCLDNRTTSPDRVLGPIECLYVA